MSRSSSHTRDLPILSRNSSPAQGPPSGSGNSSPAQHPPSRSGRSSAAQPPPSRSGSSSPAHHQANRTRSSSPSSRQWWKDVVCYQIWPQSFKDSNDDGIGDIPGIISKIPYLQELGVDVIWLSPMYESPMDDFGYDVSDWQQIHDKFGTMDDMDKLIKVVHDAGMKILLDLVVTHTSVKHPWFVKSKESQTNNKSDYYIWRDRRPGHKIFNIQSREEESVEEPTNWRAVYGDSVWEHVPKPGRDQYYLHLFFKFQADLNWENPQVRDDIFKNAIGFWLDKGVDGFRIDTVNRLSKDQNFPDVNPTKVVSKYQPGSEFCINGPRIHEFLTAMRKYMDDHRSAKLRNGRKLMIVGELPGTPEEDLKKYTHPSAKELSMVFDFDMVKLGNNDNPDEYPFHEIKDFCDGDASFTLPMFKERLDKVQRLMKDGCWGTVFMENHDQPRSAERYATPNPKYWVQANKILCLLQTTMSGTQFIYQGQEIGMRNVTADWKEQDFRDPGSIEYLQREQGQGPEAYKRALRAIRKYSRDNARTPVQWTKGKNAGFSNASKCWIGVNPSHKDRVNVEEQMDDPESIWNFWKAHIALRKEYKQLFMVGKIDIKDTENPKTFTYLKTADDGTTALVCLNFSDDTQEVHIPKELFDVKQLKYLSGTVRMPQKLDQDLQAWEGRVYLVET